LNAASPPEGFTKAAVCSQKLNKLPALIGIPSWSQKYSSMGYKGANDTGTGKLHVFCTKSILSKIVNVFWKFTNKTLTLLIFSGFCLVFGDDFVDIYIDNLSFESQSRSSYLYVKISFNKDHLDLIRRLRLRQCFIYSPLCPQTDLSYFSLDCFFG
jgi:hypothetical protein